MLDKELLNPEVDVLGGQQRTTAGEAVHGRMARRLDQLNDSVAALQTAIRNAVAEADYARHRAEADLAHAYKYSIEAFAKDLLPFKDALEAALAVDTSDAPALRTGLELSLRLLAAALEKNGLIEISPHPGTQFDGERHRPLVKLGAEDEMHRVACTEQKGYEMHGRVLRPAVVSLR